MFIAEPGDVQIACGALDENVHVTFACQYTNNTADYSHLQWIINSVEYNITQLPPHHSYDGRVLTVKKIQLGQHNSTYQCQLLSNDKNCAHRSAVGRLTINCQGTYTSILIILMVYVHFVSIAFDVQCLPSYHYRNSMGNENVLKEIVCTITQVCTKL